VAVLTIGSVAGSPGATSLALALAAAWPRRSLVIDADPDGGRLAARCDVPVRPGLTELAGAARTGLSDPGDVWRFAQRSPLGVDVVVAHPAAEQVASALRAASAPIADALLRLDGVDVIIDVGRVRPGTLAGPLLSAADRRIIVTGTRLDDAVALTHRLDLLDGFGGADIVVGGGGDHSASELAHVLGRTVLSSRPGRRARRSSARHRRREARWVMHLARRLADELALGEPITNDLSDGDLADGGLSTGDLHADPDHEDTSGAIPVGGRRASRMTWAGERDE
jgi:MinD-like ATPase involved in chromosome partitioning or flagellar assembly